MKFFELIRILILILVLTNALNFSRGWAGETPAEQLLHSYNAKPDPYAGHDRMNGYALADFPHFYDQWKMITVRYREDTHEMRFTYANEIADQALRKGVQNYPDGAVFAKIGFVSQEDPAFTSSVVPAGAKRYQFMVRDKKKFAATDGWGYVLLNGEGKTFNGEPQANSKACAACHRLVPDRGYVFSQRVEVSPYIEKLRKGVDVAQQKGPKSVLTFKTVAREKLAESLSRWLPERFKSVRQLEGLAQRDLFEGSLNELGPTLVKESLKAKLPAVVSDREGRLFAFTFAEKSNDGCDKEETKMLSGRIIMPMQEKTARLKGDDAVLKVGSHCSR